MNNEDMTHATFRSIILSRIECPMVAAFRVVELIEECWEEGDSVEDALKWCQWKLDNEVFGK